MDTKQIEYIIKIADEGSITRAAEKLFITQSALSQQLQKLEKELGAPLFVRNKSDWTLTPMSMSKMRVRCSASSRKPTR